MVRRDEVGYGEVGQFGKVGLGSACQFGIGLDCDGKVRFVTWPVLFP
ncbi:hypothetical protein ES703_104882 [subsurface metagenome]